MLSLPSFLLCPQPVPSSAVGHATEGSPWILDNKSGFEIGVHWAPLSNLSISREITFPDTVKQWDELPYRYFSNDSS